MSASGRAGLRLADQRGWQSGQNTAQNYLILYTAVNIEDLLVYVYIVKFAVYIVQFAVYILQFGVFSVAKL